MSTVRGGFSTEAGAETEAEEEAELSQEEPTTTPSKTRPRQPKPVYRFGQ